MATMGHICNFVKDLKPMMAMVAIQVANAGVNILYKLAAKAGLSLRVLVAYRFVFAAVFMVPLSLFVERGQRSRLTWPIFFQAFLIGLFGGSLGQNMLLESLALTSATFAAAMTNLVPAFTFILAILFRMEALDFGTAAGKAKVLGTLMGVGGATLLTFCKGFPIHFLSTNIHFLTSDRRHVLGALLALGFCLCCALWLIIQTKVSEKYPCPHTITALSSSMASIQAITFTLCVERDWTKWKLGWNISLWIVAYSGIVGSGLSVALMAWCVRMRGPLFVSVFNPLMLVLVAFAGSLFLGERLYFGSILGAILIICGLYAVLWGKSKEMEMIQKPSSQTHEHEEDHQNVILSNPLLNAKATGNDIV